ncbi:Clp protease/crotonase-like domain-containing protein [Sinorhizobium medicae]|nr:hypothetical protein [Sinorhizobium medicae]WQO89272.1 hypothetical protein U8C37_32845 [Sinorhizobium medicae]
MRGVICVRGVIFGILLSMYVGEYLCGGALAADVGVVTWREHRVVKLTGPIDRGKERKLAAHLAQAEALPYGLPVLLLDSPDGSVGEALRISSLLDRRPVHTVAGRCEMRLCLCLDRFHCR